MECSITSKGGPHRAALLICEHTKTSGPRKCRKIHAQGDPLGVPESREDLSNGDRNREGQESAQARSIGGNSLIVRRVQRAGFERHGEEAGGKEGPGEGECAGEEEGPRLTLARRTTTPGWSPTGRCETSRWLRFPRATRGGTEWPGYRSMPAADRVPAAGRTQCALR